jgi:hypothetical protein
MTLWGRFATPRQRSVCHFPSLLVPDPDWVGFPAYIATELLTLGPQDWFALRGLDAQFSCFAKPLLSASFGRPPFFLGFGFGRDSNPLIDNHRFICRCALKGSVELILGHLGFVWRQLCKEHGIPN